MLFENHHLDVVEVLEEAIAISAEVMVFDFVLIAIILVVVGIRADSALVLLIVLIVEMALDRHVVATCALAAKVHVAGIALISRRAMTCGTAVVIPSLPSGRECLSASSAFKHLKDFEFASEMAVVGDAFLRVVSKTCRRRVEAS